jgi:hypothetical protein
MTRTNRPFDKNTWLTPIGSALRVVDSLRHNGYGEPDFHLGGGTVLMFRFDHRISNGIDIFTYDAQALSFISPRLNEVAAREAVDYEEPANAVKLVLRHGDVNFIVAAPVIPTAAYEVINAGGRQIVLDATSEILARKLLYRADSFKARDAFDMAVALADDHAAAAEALAATRRTRPALLRRLMAMRTLTPDDLAKDMMVTEVGRPYLTGMVDGLLQAIKTIDSD